MKRTAFFSVVTAGLVLNVACSQSGPGAISGTGGAATNAGGASNSSSSSSSNEGGSATTDNTTQASGGSQNGTTNGNGGATNGATTTASNSGGQGNNTTSSPSEGGNANTAAGGTTAANTAAGGTVNNTTSAAKGGAVGNGGTTTAAPTGGAAPKGGATGNGGAATGGATVTATGGATTATSSGGITPADIVPDLAAGFYWEGSCKGTSDPGGRNCWVSEAGASYPSGGVTIDAVKNVKGTAGQTYTVTIEVRGVIGTRCYQDGKRASTAAASDNDYNNWWYIGGTPFNATGWWNTYELHVSPTTGDASKDVYYFNGSDNANGGYCEKEGTYLVKYTASFKVKGGGTMTFRIHDNNGKAQQNCGVPNSVSTDETCHPRTVDLSGMTPQPPTTFKQPPTNLAKPYYPQWVWIVAKSVTSP